MFPRFRCVSKPSIVRKVHQKMWMLRRELPAKTRDNVFVTNHGPELPGPTIVALIRQGMNRPPGSELPGRRRHQARNPRKEITPGSIFSKDHQVGLIETASER